jgi:hypothetical protein
MRHRTLAVGIICLGSSLAANAQGLPTSCDGYFLQPPGTCSFNCMAGRPISISGFAEAPSGTVSIQIIADCDGVEMVRCEGLGHSAAGCGATSTIVPAVDGVGTCFATSPFSQFAEFHCATQ